LTPRDTAEPQPRRAPSGPDSLPAGRVGRPHGLDGSFYVTRPRARLLSVGATVTLAGRTASIVRRAGTEQRPIVRLEGIDERSAAEALRGTDLYVHGGDAPALAEGEWWSHELEGCAVVDGRQLLGTVNRLIELPSCEALEVHAADGGEVLLVPMVKDAVRVVAPAHKRIEVDLEFLDLASRAREAGEPAAGEPPTAGGPPTAGEPGGDA
jgi:16S rRNA processing protein RimM